MKLSTDYIEIGDRQAALFDPRTWGKGKQVSKPGVPRPAIPRGRPVGPRPRPRPQIPKPAEPANSPENKWYTFTRSYTNPITKATTTHTNKDFGTPESLRKKWEEGGRGKILSEFEPVSPESGKNQPTAPKQTQQQQVQKVAPPGAKEFEILYDLDNGTDKDKRITTTRGEEATVESVKQKFERDIQNPNHDQNGATNIRVRDITKGQQTQKPAAQETDLPEPYFRVSYYKPGTSEIVVRNVPGRGTSNTEESIKRDYAFNQIHVLKVEKVDSSQQQAPQPAAPKKTEQQTSLLPYEEGRVGEWAVFGRHPTTHQAMHKDYERMTLGKAIKTAIQEEGIAEEGMRVFDRGKGKYIDLSQRKGTGQQQQPGKQQVSWEVMVTTPDGENRRRFHLTGTEEKVKENIRQYRSKDYKVDIRSKTAGQHYVLTLEKEDGTQVKMLGYGDKDRLQKKFSEGYTVRGIEPMKVPPQPKGYSIFTDAEVLALLEHKGVTKDQIRDLQQTKLRGTAPVSASRMIGNRFWLSPYYTRFSDN